MDVLLKEKIDNYFEETFKRFGIENYDGSIESFANDMIRFDGYKENGIKVNAMISQVEDLRYTIQIDIKDGKYRLSLISMERYFKDTVRNQYSISSRWIDVMSEVPLCFKKNGDLKSYCKYYPNAFEGLINDINTSVYNFITNNTVEKSKNDNW